MVGGTLDTGQDNLIQNTEKSEIFSSFLIGGDGNIYEGRGWNIQGAHTGGFNTVGYGVCFMGDFTDHNPTEQAIVAYNSLVECAVNTEKIVSDYNMFGHRQTKPEGGTECPGDFFYQTIQTWSHWVGLQQMNMINNI